MPVYKNDPNLKGLWLMEEASGTRFDYTSNNNDLSDNNTVGSSADAQEGALSADFELANSEYLSIADGSQTGLDITSSLSIVLWYKPESIASGTEQQLVAKYRTADSNRAYRMTAATAGTAVRMTLSSNGTATTSATGATALSAGNWYHLAGIYNGTDIRVYVNGSLDSNGASNPASYSSGIFNSGAAFQIGVQESSSFYVDGLIDEVAIFNRALSAAEVADIFNNGLLNPARPIRPNRALSRWIRRY